MNVLYIRYCNLDIDTHYLYQ